ncbi:patatin-like phospholipase family protein [Delftia acidovorans]|nr:patatin-like phospholipase family protein [Delftia acidovorans]
MADLEQEIGGPIAERFDLIAGTSIGGILALAVAMEIPAEHMVNLFERHGNEIFKRRFSLWGIVRAPYSPEPLKQLLGAPELFGDQALGSCKHPVIVPAINYSTGQPQLFKTPHHETFRRDHQLRLVDIAMATSAAPAYFPRHTFNNNQYVDGGLYANAPGLLALHEAQTFFGQAPDFVHMISIGTMSSKFTADPRRNRSGGTYDWGGLHPANMPKRLFGLSISVQESLSDFMLKHSLSTRYVPIDDLLTDERAGAVALDKTNAPAREVLIGAASEKSKACIGREDVQAFLKHHCATPKFYYGPNTSREI